MHRARSSANDISKMNIKLPIVASLVPMLLLNLILFTTMCVDGFLSSTSSIILRHKNIAKEIQRIDSPWGKLNFRLYDAYPSLYQEQEKLLVNRGVIESELMEKTGSPIAASISKGSGAAKGFGASTGMKPAEIKAAAKVHAKELRKSGVVRIDNILTGDMADQLREYVFDLRKEF